MRFARTCYGHLAGKLGVAITQATCARQFLDENHAGYEVTAAGRAWFHTLGIEVAMLKRRPLTRQCLDWSERRHHLAGALGVALASRMFELGWITHVRRSRALRVTDRGAAALRAELGLEPRMARFSGVRSAALPR